MSLEYIIARVKNMNMKFKKVLAFSLAEILVTLGIVGAVAAMTIPTLNYNRVKKEKSVRLKRFYSKMTNALETMNMEGKPYRAMSKPSKEDAFDWYMTNVDPYMGHKSVNKTDKTIYYGDGSSLVIRGVGGCLDAIYDVNADKKPNYYGRDIFHFLYCFDDLQRTYWFGDPKIFFGPYAEGPVADKTRADLIAGCAHKGGDCPRLLLLDNWEFKNDYPLK